MKKRNFFSTQRTFQRRYQILFFFSSYTKTSSALTQRVLSNEFSSNTGWGSGQVPQVNGLGPT